MSEEILRPYRNNTVTKYLFRIYAYNKKVTYSLASPLLVNSQQKNILLTAKNAWLEGDQSLDNWAEQAKIEGVFRQIQPCLPELSGEKDQAEAAKLRLLPLVRRLSFRVNPALGRPSGESLGTLLFGDAPIATRLLDFLTTQPVGIQTASHWLHAAFPEIYPLLTPLLKSVLSPTPKQRAQANRLARERFPEAEASLLPVLTDWMLYASVKEVLGVSSYADVNAILRYAHRMPISKSKKRGGTATLVREESNAYQAHSYTDRDVIAYLEAFILGKGFTFPAYTIASYYLALKAKPFAILAGLSGTGKTRLTALIAEGLTEKTSAQYLLLPVRPDWTDPTPLLGYFNPLTARYHRTIFLDFLTEASRSENSERVFFVCLDEMNLARVEHYFADLLSGMETEERQIILGDSRRVRLPPNLFLTGSVNIDEASHPFSRKVLDRANVLEFATVNLAMPTALPKKSLPVISPQERQRIFLASPAPLPEGLKTEVIKTLITINTYLTPAGQHFGYRVRDEILQYISTSQDVLTLETALDLQLLQKVLPRLSGVSETLLPVLRLLMAHTQARFPLTSQKLERMCQRGETLGFITFFE